MTEQERLAVLWADRHDTKESLKELAEGQSLLRETLIALPEKLGKTIRSECITRQEFRTVKGAMGLVAAGISAIMSFLLYLFGVHRF